MLELGPKSKVLVVVAHPDDELLGLGGTLQKLKFQFDCSIRVVILGEGITSRENDIDQNLKKLEIHKKNIEEAKKILGYDQLKLFDLPDNKFDTVPLLSIIKIIESEKNYFNPDIIFTHHLGDVNIDHQITFKSVNTAFRPQPNEKFKAILTFETPSGTEWIASNDNRKFNPNIFVELNEKQMENKINAMECYLFEKREYPHPRSPEALKVRAKMWGIANGVKYAEPFQLIRMIDRN